MLTKKDAIACGYVSKKAWDEVNRLTDRQIRMLAALAITHYDSPYTDNGRDLVRGTREVLGRDYY